MSTFLRRDEWITDATGNAISGAQVYVCSQPATTGSIPPSPLIQLYSDPAGADPITQPVLTDGFGHAFYYASPGIYTVVYNSPQIGETVLADQNVGGGDSVTFPITVAEGGTGATTAPAARAALGAAASGANSDITSLAGISNTAINSSGYLFGSGAFGTPSAPQAAIANQSWTGTGVTGYGFGVQDAAENFSLLSPGFIVTNGTVQGNQVNSLGNASISGAISVGSGSAAGVITSRGTNQGIQIGGEGITTNPLSVLISPGLFGSSPVSGVGLLGFGTNYFTQTTVGAAGAASALPATPRGYLQFVDPTGVVCVFPYYKAS